MRYQIIIDSGTSSVSPLYIGPEKALEECIDKRTENGELGRTKHHIVDEDSIIYYLPINKEIRQFLVQVISGSYNNTIKWLFIYREGCFFRNISVF
ncbi:MAG: hypothetical protein QMD85_02945 [Candidatus Aenigmarchaeota archaeon]|nr:hypothetical protein [Candidatus Aenigmarchaeota archaeon]